MKAKTLLQNKKPLTSKKLSGIIAATGEKAPNVIVGRIIFSPEKGSSTKKWQEYLTTIRTAKNLIAIAKQAEVEALILAPNFLLAIVTAIGGVTAHGFKIAREHLNTPQGLRQAVVTQVPDLIKLFSPGDTMKIVLDKKKNTATISKLD